MSDETILVTGAAGFIGGRVTHRLALGEDWSVVPLVHSISGSGTMRAGRLPVDIEQGSILDREHMEALLEDCTAVINCAHGGRDVTIDGTRTLLDAAESGDIETYIHLSSAVVHGHDAAGRITEETPLAPDTDYAKRKADAEQVIRDWDGDLEPTVFRPCIVYGPHSPWVRRPLTQLRKGAVLADGGIGDLNQVHVDNLVDALFAAVDASAAAGEVFMVADDEPLTWFQYYRRLGELLGDHPPIQALSTTELSVYKTLRYCRNSVVPPLRLGKAVVTAPETLQRAAEELGQTPWVQALYKRLPSEIQENIKNQINATAPASNRDGPAKRSVTYQYPPENQAKMQSTRGRLSTEKLESRLGWESRISVEEGMALLGQWAEYEGLTGPRLPSSTAPGAEDSFQETGSDCAQAHGRKELVHQGE